VLNLSSLRVPVSGMALHCASWASSILHVTHNERRQDHRKNLDDIEDLTLEADHPPVFHPAPEESFQVLLNRLVTQDN